MVNILVFSFIAGLATFLGALVFRRLGRRLDNYFVYLLSLAVGLFLANAFLHLLPEAIVLNSNWPYWLLGTIGAFYLLEQALMIHSCREENCEAHARGLLGFLGLGFHSLIDGLVIGISFQAGITVGVVASLAIIFHKLAEGGFTYFLLAGDEKLRGRALGLSVLIALATPVGALFSIFWLSRISYELLGGFFALAAGSFIYIGASDLLPATHKRSGWWNAVFVFLGFLFVVLVRYLSE